jgi:acetamidase/formamidase
MSAWAPASTCRSSTPAQVFFADPHAVISDGIISGTGIECSALVRSRIGLNKGVKLDRPIIEQADTVQILGWGPTVEAATEDASRGSVDFVASRTGLSREEAYMLLGITGELRVGTSPRPVMCARLMIPRSVLEAAGMKAVI